MTLVTPVAVRFWRKVDRREPDECWPWLGALNRGGYGHFSITSGHSMSAYRYAYTAEVGPIPAGMSLDHTCHDPRECVGGPTCPHRRCVNPAHLRPCTTRENVMRGNTLPAMNAAKTECSRGHPLSGTNLRINPATGDRVCRTCARENTANYRARRKAGV